MSYTVCVIVLEQLEVATEPTLKDALARATALAAEMHADQMATGDFDEADYGRAPGDAMIRIDINAE